MMSSTGVRDPEVQKAKERQERLLQRRAELLKELAGLEKQLRKPVTNGGSA